MCSGALLAAACAGVLLPEAGRAAPTRSSGHAYYSFVSAPNLHPPNPQVLTRKPGLAPGDFLAAPSGPIRGTRSNSAGQGGALILASDLSPVWFEPAKGEIFSLQQETYDGKPVLVSFQAPGGGRIKHGGHGHRRRARTGGLGAVVVFNEHYKEIATIRARAPWSTDLHDASIVGGDIWITVVRSVKENLTAYGGSRNGQVIDVGLQEFALGSGRLIRTWDALNPGGPPNVPLTASEEPVASGPKVGGPVGAWDAYHLNSVQALPDGDLLVSMRNTWSVYLIDPVTEKILWTLGGKDSSFAVGSGASFAWQHDARLVDPATEGEGANVELTLFNDDNGGPSRKPSAGMILALDSVTHRATLVHAYHHQPPLSAGIMGSMQLLPGGNALVGWGSEPYFSEYSPSGVVLLDARWPGSSTSYRTLFTDTWVGSPQYPPRGAVRGKTVYASWNGATQVTKWEVLAGSTASQLRVVATRGRSGFETAIRLGHSYRAYEVRALEADGRALGTSKVFS